MTSSPTARADTSRSPRLRTLCTMRLTASSICLARHRPLLQRLVHAGAQLALVERLAAAVALDHQRHHQLGGLEGREALAALQALAAAADLPPLARQARVVHLGLVVAAEGTVHRGASASSHWYTGKRRHSSITCGRTRSTTAAAPSASSTSAIEVDHLLDLGLAEAARGDGGRADAQAARDHRRARIVRHRVLVDRDVARPSAASASLPVMLRVRPGSPGTGDCRCRRRRSW